MPPARPFWKGYLKLSLVSCPIALFPASSSSERVSFRQISKKTGHRLKQQLVDSITGEVVESQDKGRGYQIGKEEYMPVEDEELDNLALESTKIIDLEKFVPRSEIDERYLDSPYYLTPEDKVGQDAFAVIREAMKRKNMVGLGKVVISRRERIVMLEPLDQGLMATTLRYAYEVRDGDDDLAQAHHVLALHRLPDHGERILPDMVLGGQVVRRVEIALVDLGARNELLDVDDLRAFQGEVVKLLVLHRHVFVLADLIAPPLVPGLDHLAGDGIDQLLLQAVPGLLADLTEAHPLARCRSREQGDGAGDEGQLQVSLPERAGGRHGRTPIRNIFPDIQVAVPTRVWESNVTAPAPKMQRGGNQSGTLRLPRNCSWARRHSPSPPAPCRLCETPALHAAGVSAYGGHRWKCPGASLCEWAPMSGDVLPHFWQRKPMLPMKVSRLTPLRWSSRGNGKSVIRPQLQVSRRNV